MGIEVIARDWDRPDWYGAFYPEDLPEDWRLTYFANAFESVLVPAAVWQKAALGRLAQWAGDVPPRFCFYLELGPSDQPHGRESPPRDLEPTGDDSQSLTRAAAALGDRFAGSVAGPPLPVGPAGSGPGPEADPAQALEAWDAEGGALLAWLVPQTVLANPRASVAWLAALAAEAGPRPALAILEDASPKALTDWCQLVLLAGFA
jgi:hypothetical protein